jgi:hypothetical protein
MSAVKPRPTEANMLAVEHSSIPLSSDASDGEVRCNHQNSSSKCRARHSLLQALHLATSDLTPRKQKLCDRIRSEESTLWKLRKKYRAKKLKYLCDVDSDPLMQSISYSLNVVALRLLAAIIRNSKHKLKRRRWNFKDKILALFLLKRSPKSYTLL